MVQYTVHPLTKLSQPLERHRQCSGPSTRSWCTTSRICWFLLHDSLPFNFAYGCSLQPAALEHLVRCAHFPMKLGFCTLFFATAEWMAYTWSANHLERNTVCFPLLGVLGTPDSATLHQQRMDDSCPYKLWPYAQVHLRGR